jgi:hypothetical protein
MLAIALALLGLVLYIYIGFLALCTAKRIRAAKVWTPPGMTALVVVLVALFYPADVLWNYTFGTLQFRELPKWREWMFSWRIQRYVKEPTPSKAALRWGSFLDAGDAGHIDMPANWEELLRS